MFTRHYGFAYLVHDVCNVFMDRQFEPFSLNHVIHRLPHTFHLRLFYNHSIYHNARLADNLTSLFIRHAIPIYDVMLSILCSCSKLTDF